MASDLQSAPADGVSGQERLRAGYRRCALAHVTLEDATAIPLYRPERQRSGHKREESK